MRAAPEQSAHAGRGVLSGKGESLLRLKERDKPTQFPVVGYFEILFA